MTAKKAALPKGPSEKVIILALQILIAILFITLGIQGFADEQGVTKEIGVSIERVFGGDSDIYQSVIAAAQLLCGAVLGASLFALVDTKVIRIALDTVIVIWAVVIIVLDILGQSFSSGGFDWLFWLQSTSVHLILLAALLLVKNRRG